MSDNYIGGNGGALMTQCPYLEKRDWLYSAFSSLQMETCVYESLLERGWRRSGSFFYQNLCADCEECRPLRVDVAGFSPSKSQRRVLKRNSDIVCSVKRVSRQKADFGLYDKYSRIRHPSADLPDRALFSAFFVESPLDTRIVKYYLGGSLLGIAWTDVMPNSLSSVYFVFDPDYSKRSLGVFSILKQIELCRTWGKDWLHLGFYIKGSRKMSYKAAFRPCEVFEDGEWTLFDDTASV